MGLEKVANRGALPTDDSFQDRDQHGKRIAPQHAALGDLGNVFGFRDGDGEAVAQVDMQHDVQVGAAVTHVNNVVGTDLQLGLQLVERGHLAVPRGSADDGVNLPAAGIAELGAKDVVRWNYSFQGRPDHFDGRGGEHVKIEMVTIDSAGQDLVEQIDILLQADALADFVQVFFAHPAAKHRIVQQQVSEFRTLLDEVQLRHTGGFALEFLRGNAEQLT